MKKFGFILLLCAFAVATQAADVRKGNLAFNIVSKRYHIAEATYLPQEESVNLQKAVIPSHFWYKARRYKVSVIGNGAFGGCWKLRYVQIPATVTALGKGAFAWCINLEEIELPEGICVIAEDAFSSCPNLKAVYVPQGHKQRIQDLLPKELRYLVKEKG
ncbi:MAG: leucine-rich repeat domain-containing protein [Paludibacteraceae bacterium]|nr:leucine-rich repeat domain-containing protein [Paludibacteraceae bacterium]MBR1717070.1 leucine-rich repeat domain-containing protein [Paludibacteraceae bacterium]